MSAFIFLVAIAGGIFASWAMDRDKPEHRGAWKLAIVCFIIGALGIVFTETEELGEYFHILFFEGSGSHAER